MDPRSSGNAVFYHQIHVFLDCNISIAKGTAIYQVAATLVIDHMLEMKVLEGCRLFYIFQYNQLYQPAPGSFDGSGPDYPKLNNLGENGGGKKNARERASLPPKFNFHPYHPRDVYNPVNLKLKFSK